MRIMTRMGKAALEAARRLDRLLQGPALPRRPLARPPLHLHFPEEKLIWSVGSGYGGNALLGKKCFALRIASTMARDEGWLAEHMLILGVEAHRAHHYIAPRSPAPAARRTSRCSCRPQSNKGWKVWTVGDDIAWLRVGPDGRLWAINPEAGFFGVAPGTSDKTNPNAWPRAQKNSIFTNVALTADGAPGGKVWRAARGADRLEGQPWTPGKRRRPRTRTAASPRPPPVPLDLAQVRRPRGRAHLGHHLRRTPRPPRAARLRSLRLEHGVFVGATMASETTAAATGKVGVVRRDPMAMRPFCGYNMADYFGHWLAMGQERARFPKIFHVNWFRTNERASSSGRASARTSASSAGS
jgi:phosphoenolpyruvate carboxykinase (GTP)